MSILFCLPAGAGSLGLLIPPSIVMIVYGAASGGVDQSAVHGGAGAGAFDRFSLQLLHLLDVAILKRAPLQSVEYMNPLCCCCPDP